MDNISVMHIKPLGDQTCSVDGGGHGGGWSPPATMLAIILSVQACAAFLYMTLSMLGCYLLN